MDSSLKQIFLLVVEKRINNTVITGRERRVQIKLFLEHSEATLKGISKGVKETTGGNV